MVLVAFQSRAIGTEALARCIVVVINPVARPVVALDAEMVVSLAAELALARPTLENALGKRDAGGNVIAKHLLDGEVLVFVDIALEALVPLCRLCISKKGRNEQEAHQV